MTMARTGRPKIEFDKRAFADLVGFGCTQEEICWFFRDIKTGRAANPDTLTRWCKREYGQTFQEYKKQNSLMPLKIQLRKNQLELSKKSAAMAIWLGKQYLEQRDSVEVTDTAALEKLDAILRTTAENAAALDRGKEDGNN